ncbi:hypothetical protein QAD02_022629 [Eretmocerus hayati]|uniref:Uncharacterized protein n=1 Tax=Eretmocerus hayati TaxID=131215 RepID=A0ACC2PYF5_9HYME|nr:hypothetical protein QAD02_022629 [Eretmocerus hayati]
MGRGYHSEIYNELMERDGPIGDEDDEQVNRNADVHKHNPVDPLRDYLIPRQDSKGLISYGAAQIPKDANLQISKVEPLNPRRRNMGRGYHSEIYDELMERDGPIGDEDDELVNRNADGNV